MKQLLVLMAMSTSVMLGHSQGIEFEQGMSWKQVQERAKTEGKYIFLDCYTTWCGPCKEMERIIYPNEKVGDYFKDKFISVQVQMDTSMHDNEEVIGWYKDAHNIMQRYNIAAFPSFLFFSPDGKIVHRGLGFMDVNDFLFFSANAYEPSRQYYTLVEKYRHGKIDYDVMPYLANTAKEVNDNDLARVVACDYVNNYMMKLKKDDIYSKVNIEFAATFVTSRDRSFEMFYHHKHRIDKIIREGFSQNIVDYVITKEEIDPRLWENLNTDKPIAKKPNWVRITDIVTKKYGKCCADRTILNAKLRWYEYKRDTAALVKYNVEKIDKFGIDTVGFSRGITNNMIFDLIFNYSTNRIVIDKAIKWMRILIHIEPGNSSYLDTYANLLYKSGRISNAIFWESKAKKLDESHALQEKRIPDANFKDTLEKMVRGEPTWARI